MSFARAAVFVVLAALLAGCSSPGAFVDRREMERSVKKQKLPGYDGMVTVCYDGETPRAERDRLAVEACEVYGLKAVLYREQNWQCRLTTPHRAVYYCYDPELRMADGRLVDPFSKGQVDDWRREREAAGKGDGAETGQ